MLKKAYESRILWHPILQGGPLPALQYGDDTLIITHDLFQQDTFLKHNLDVFAAFTSLKINFQNTTFFPCICLSKARMMLHRSLVFPCQRIKSRGKWSSLQSIGLATVYLVGCRTWCLWEVRWKWWTWCCWQYQIIHGLHRMGPREHWCCGQDLMCIFCGKQRVCVYLAACDIVRPPKR
jgi:hypothetical protein